MGSSIQHSLNQGISASNPSWVDEAIRAGERPDQETIRYTIKFTTYLRSENRGEPNKIPQVRETTSLLFLTYTNSSLKRAIATQNLAIVKSVLEAGAWLYGIEKKPHLYQDERREKIHFCDTDSLMQLDERVEFGNKKEWEIHLAKAEQACGGNCVSDAQKTGNSEIVKSVAQHILSRGLR